MVKDIGLGVKPPAKKCKDIHCPFHGKLKIRGRIFTGEVLSSKMQGTVTVGWDRICYLQKFERYEKRETKIFAHNPPCISAKEGDIVVVGECRPLSKGKKFVIIEKK